MTLETKAEKLDTSKYPWFTILIADGQKDIHDEIMYLGRGTEAIIPKEVDAIMNNRRDSIFGKLEVVQFGHELRAKFISCNPIAEAILLDLTPSLTGRYIKKNKSFLEVIELTAISFDFGKNCDHRIKSLKEQRAAQEILEEVNRDCCNSEVLDAGR